MRYFPINLDIRDKTVVVIGGGSVAARKCRQLLAAGARVKVIAPQLGKSLRSSLAKGLIAHLDRSYLNGDLAGAVLAIAATDDLSTNAAIAAEAAAASIPAAVVNAPQLGTFISPAIVSRGDLLITVSTGGKAPALSRQLRQELEKSYGPEYGKLVRLLAELREKLLTGNGGSTYNKKILQSLAADLTDLLRQQPATALEELLQNIPGSACNIDRQGKSAKDTP